MPSRLRAAAADAAGHLAETACLGAIVCIPLYVDRVSQMPFAASKVGLLWIFAAVGGAALLMRAFGLRGPRPGGWRQHPVPVVAGLWLLACVVATLGSHAPIVSFLGTTERMQGLTTRIALAILFLAAITCVRHSARWSRLLHVHIAVSSLVVVLGLLEYAGLSPIVPEHAVGPRISSTLGNPIFLGAYLLFGLFAAIGSTLIRFRRGRHRSAWILALLALLHLVGLLATGSRGPLLGMAVGIVLLGAGLVREQIGHRIPARTPAIAAAILVAATLLAWGLGAPLGRAITAEGPTVRFRLAVWEVAGASLGDRQGPLAGPRALIGVGPELVWPTIGPYLSLDAARYSARAAPDRTHSQPLDVLLETGTMGLTAWMSLWLAAIWRVAVAGNLLDRRQAARLAGVTAAACLAAPVLLRLADGSLRYLGPVLAAGLVLPSILAMAFVRPPTTAGRHPGWMAAAGLLAAHFVQLAFGFEITETRMLFWLGLAAIATAAGGCRPPRDTSEPGYGIVFTGAVTFLGAVTLLAGLASPPTVAVDVGPATDRQLLVAGADPILIVVGLVGVTAALGFRRPRAYRRATITSACVALLFAAGPAAVMSSRLQQAGAALAVASRQLQDGKLEDAAVTADRATRLAPWILEGWLAAGEARSRAALREDAAPALLTEARDRLDAARRIHPLQPTTHLALARLTARAAAGDPNRVREALGWYERALQLDPRDPRARLEAQGLRRRLRGAAEPASGSPPRDNR